MAGFYGSSGKGEAKGGNIVGNPKPKKKKSASLKSKMVR